MNLAELQDAIDQRECLREAIKGTGLPEGDSAWDWDPKAGVWHCNYEPFHVLFSRDEGWWKMGSSTQTRESTYKSVQQAVDAACKSLLSYARATKTGAERVIEDLS